MDFRRISSPQILQQQQQQLIQQQQLSKQQHSLNISRTKSPRDTLITPVTKTNSWNKEIKRSLSSNNDKKPVKYTRNKRVSSVATSKQITRSRIKREQPNPTKFNLLAELIENAIKEGIKAGEDLMEIEENNKVGVTLNILQHHLENIEGIKNEYQRQMKIKDGATNLEQALAERESRATKKTLNELKSSNKSICETLLDIEDELFDSLGYLQITVKGILDFPKMVNNDSYEVKVEVSEQKWKTKGTVKNQIQNWPEPHVMMTILGDDTIMSVQAVQIRRLIGNLELGSAKLSALDLISLHAQNVIIVLRGDSNVKLNIEIKWRLNYDDPDYPTAFNFEMLDVIIGTSKFNEYQKKRQNSIQKVKKRTMSKRKYSDEIPLEFVPLESEGIVQDSTILIVPKRANKSPGEGSTTAMKTSISMPLIANVRKISSVLHRSPSQFVNQGILNANSPIISVSETAREDLMTTLQLGVYDDRNESISNVYINPLHEAYDNLWSSIEHCKEHLTVYLLEDLQQRLTKLSMLIKNGTTKRRTSLTESETDALDSFDFLEDKERSNSISQIENPLSSIEAYSNNNKDVLNSSSNSKTNLTLYENMHMTNADNMNQVHINLETLKECIDLQPDDYSSGEDELDLMLQDIVDFSTNLLAEDANLTQNLKSPIYSDMTAPALGSPTQVRMDKTSHINAPFFSFHEDNVPSDDVTIEDTDTFTTGNDDLDIALTYQLIYCDGLVQNIKPSSPLSWKSNESFIRLKKQIEHIDTVLDNLDGSNLTAINFIPKLGHRNELHEFWKTCCKKSELYTNIDDFSLALDKMFGDQIFNGYPDVAHIVFPTIACNIINTDLEDGSQTTSQYITIFQYFDYFKGKLGGGFEEYLNESADDLSLYEGLISQERYVVNVTLKRMAGMGYNPGILRAVPHMFMQHNESYQIAENYIKNITRDAKIKEKVGEYFKAILEHSDQQRRQGSCRALKYMKYKKAVDQLKYVRDIDLPPVKHEAELALQHMAASEN